MANLVFRGSPRANSRARRMLHLASQAPLVQSGGNVAADQVASASVINLNYGTSELIEITGTTAITGFTGAVAKNEWRSIIFLGALTLTHNATSFILPGSANIITVAGDTAEFVSLDTANWKCIRFTRGGVPTTPGATLAANVRLTLESGVPISVTDQVDKAVLYATPHFGNHLPLYNGTSWQTLAFSEMSIKGSDASQSATRVSGSPTLTGLTDTSKLARGMRVTGTGMPAAGTITAIVSATSVTLSDNATSNGTDAVTFFLDNFNADIFSVLASGVPSLRFSKWTNATSRANAISLLNGIYVNTSAIGAGDSNEIPANQGTYLGTVKFISDGLMRDTSVSRYVWNMFNRVVRHMFQIEPTDTWTYSTDAYRVANDTSLNQLNFVRGLDDDMVEAGVTASVVNSTTTLRNCRIGIGLDSDTVNSATVYQLLGVGTARFNLHAFYRGYPGLGYHDLRWLERGGGADTQTWAGDQGGIRQNGIFGSVMC